VDVESLQADLRSFAQERNWERFHSPKNLATALVVEAAELAEIFQWMDPVEVERVRSSEDHMERIRDEVGDVTNYLVRLADVLGIDIERAAREKIDKNAAKYPPGFDAPRSAKEGLR
jgi:dCTP diphosphatase